MRLSTASPKYSDHRDLTLDFTVDFDHVHNMFAMYFGGLFLLAYLLSLFVSYLHIRVDPVVTPLTIPQPGMFFTEYIILVKTSLRLGSGLDPRGRLSIQLKGNFADSPKLYLTKGKNIDFFLNRGSTDIFVYHSPHVLGEIEEIEFELANDFPFELKDVSWRPSFISVQNPVTREHWGCAYNSLIKCEDAISVTAKCIPKLRHKNGIVAAFCIFHPWICVFNSPVRLGMYGTFVHTVFFYFIASLGLSISLLLYLIMGPKVYVVLLAYFAGIWFLGILCEATLRKTIPKFGAAKYSFYQGLVEPVKSQYGLSDFLIDDDWDKVRPLVFPSTVTVAIGSQHGSCYHLFPIASPKSIFNLWGLFGIKEEKLMNKGKENSICYAIAFIVLREPSLFLRALNICALSLPMSMMWLSIEATGLKENVLLQQAVTNYEQPVCVFDTWLQDWPMKYADDPKIAGLIFSHIICKDLIALIKLKKAQRRATMAQVCVHQWHGLMCCLFVNIIVQVLEQKGSSTSALRGFIYRTVLKLGRRTPREIKTVWKERSLFRNEHGHLLSSKEDEENINENAPRNKGESEDDKLLPQAEDMSISASLSDVQEKQLPPREQEQTQTHNPHFTFNFNQNDNANTLIPKPKDYIRMSRSFYETFPLGSAFASNLAPKLLNEEDDLFVRHKNEISGYCCKKKTCVCFLEIHEKVGKSCLEMLRDVLLEFRSFMKKSTKIQKLSMLWKREKMVNRLITAMREQAQFYDSHHFQSGTSSSFQGFECLRLFMSIYNILQDILQGADKLEEKSTAYLKKWEKTRPKRRVGKKSCIFCAMPLENQTEEASKGCDNMEQLVKYFSKGTVFVSEKEMNIQVIEKYSMRNYCASIICQAKDELLMECEDPPLVMAAYVMQATAYTLLTEMLPKETDFREMSQDELRLFEISLNTSFHSPGKNQNRSLVLAESINKISLFRRLGTRLQRIKARRTTGSNRQSQSIEERMRLNKITHMIEELGTKWKMAKKDRSFSATTSLFAKALVQERIFGITVYSGFISKEHEMLLGSNKYWLTEIEAIATFAVSRIARKMISQILKQVLYKRVDIDVIFHDFRRELNYCCEQINVQLFRSEARYMSTCCYYINDIIQVQLKDYRKILKDMRTTDLKEPGPGIFVSRKGKQFKVNAKKITLLKEYDHEDVASPLMRWGKIVISGEPPLPEECRPLREDRHDLGEFIHDFVREEKGSKVTRQLLTGLLRIRRGIDNLLQAENHVRRKQFQNHLSHIHAYLSDQTAASIQAISQNYTLGDDNVREFHRDDLFNVEMFASNKMNQPIITFVGYLLMFIMIFFTVTSICLMTFKTITLGEELLKEWLLLSLTGFAFYGLILIPIKCTLYSLLGFYTD